MATSALDDHLQRYRFGSDAGIESSSDASESGRTAGNYAGNHRRSVDNVASSEEPSFLSLVFADTSPSRGSIADNVRMPRST